MSRRAESDTRSSESRGGGPGVVQMLGLAVIVAALGCEAPTPGDGAGAVTTEAADEVSGGGPVGSCWTNGLGMRFVRVEPQELELVAREHRRDGYGPIRRRVRISRTYWISEHEVSLDHFVRVVGRRPASEVGDSRLVDDASAPAISVTHAEATEFCERLSRLAQEGGEAVVHRLPTEAEWALFASLHPRSFRFEYPMTPLHWTVWEWCADRDDPSYYESMPSVDPVGSSSGEGHIARVAWSHPDPWFAVWGFRVVAEAPGARAGGSR